MLEPHNTAESNRPTLHDADPQSERGRGGGLSMGVLAVLFGLVFLYASWSADQKGSVVRFKGSTTSPLWGYIASSMIVTLGLWAVAVSCFRRWR